MTTAAPASLQHDAIDTRETRQLAITDGEINFLWSFIQGSVMIPETWNALLRGFGFCERHAWVHLSVEMSFRKRHFLGPVILYRALIDKAVQAVHVPKRIGARSLMRQLRAGGPCRLCELNIPDAAAGASSPARLDRGRDSSRLRAFAAGLELLWRPAVCAVCAGEIGGVASSSRCRRHLLDDMRMRRPADLAWQRSTLQELSGRLARYEESFVAGADEPRDEDRAALVSSIGWCSGWRLLLALVSNGP